MNLLTPFRVVDERTDGDAAVFTVVVPEDCPFFDGHFPGRPVLPAIGQLVLIERLHLLRQASHAGVSEIENLRFVRPVAPGEMLTVKLDEEAGGSRTRFEIRGEGGTVSRGVLRWAGSGAV